MSRESDAVDGQEPVEEIQAGKAELRQRAKSNRIGLRIDHERVVGGLARFLRERVSGWTVLYSPLPGEPDVWRLRGHAGLGPLALTRTPERGLDLTVHPVDAPLERHRFGFEQPVADAPRIDLGDIQAVLVPGLAFDRHGGRLGFGAGYYDRFLARLAPATLRIGVSDGFIVARVPTEDHDVPMTHVASEAGVVAVPF